jgi:hypothetical protein
MRERMQDSRVLEFHEIDDAVHILESLRAIYQLNVTVILAA